MVLYKKLRNKVREAVRVAIQDHYSGLIEKSKNNPKQMWQTINNVLDRNSSKVSVTSLNYEGKFLTNDSEIVNAFNKPFISVGPILADEIKTKSTEDLLAKISDKNSMITNFKAVDTQQILEALTGLKTAKPAGLIKSLSD